MKQNDNVIQFPKEQALRVRLRERGNQQKAVLALSILSVLMLSVLSNQWVTRAERSVGGGRSIASIGAPAGSQVSDIKWEHELASQLSKSKDLHAHFAVKPSLRDELVFGALEGRYGVQLAQGHVASIQFVDEQNGQEPLLVKDRADFLNRYRSVFALEFSQAGFVSASNGVETWNLVAGDKTIVGQAKFTLDNQGRMTAFSITR